MIYLVSLLIFVLFLILLRLKSIDDSLTELLKLKK